ncbi:MAG: Smr/MutS family protein [Bacteroidales bacterium]|nr:Smr/MutS family protein [Bacteroidales bacterium]
MTYPERFEQKIGFDAVRQSVKSLCASTLGYEPVEAMGFMTDYEAITHQLRATAQMLGLITAGDDLPLGGVSDVRPTLSGARVAGTFIAATDLLPLRRWLEALSAIASFFAAKRGEDGESTVKDLDEVAAGLPVFPLCLKAIDRIIDRFGNIKDNASPELAEIRRQLSGMNGTVNTALRRVMARAIEAGYLDSDAAPTLRDGRLVLPVSPMNKRRINGIVHDESASGKTVFIEPAEVVEINNRIRELEMEERREIARILTLLTDELRPHIPEMIEACTIVGELDFIHAKALYAREIEACLPRVARGPEMEWYHACHPVLLASLRRQGKEIVPLNIQLTEKNRILVISGPNAGGKSVCLKTVGMVQYMLQCGLLPPVYENSCFGTFDDIFIDIGDDQSIEDDLSTYSSHLRAMKQMVSRGRATSLVLIDEFGGGTEPQIGGAIAQSILHRFNDLKMWGVITTHYHNLKHFAEDTEGLINGSMLYDRQAMRPLFQLSIGTPGSSFALEIARKTGLPAEIIAEAQEIVGSDYINMDKYLLDIAKQRRYWENKRMAIRQKEKKIESVLAQYEEDASALREKRREIISEAREEARKILEGSNAAIERTIHDIRRAQADKQQTLEARRRLAEERRELEGTAATAANDGDHPLLDKARGKSKKSKVKSQKVEAPETRPLAVGDTVKLDGEGTPGRIESISGKTATVVFGMLRTTVALERLKPTLAKIPAASGRSSFVSTETANQLRDRQLNFSRDIDVRGMRVDEALQAITYFIDDAIQFNADRVRILHGTGTGALRQSIRQYLDTVKGVRAYRDEHVQFGGAGITVVDLD